MIQHFPPSFTPKPAQVKLLNEVEKAFQKTKFVIVSAPTGTGKSFISATLANSSDPASQKFKDLVNSYEAYATDDSGAFLKGEECGSEPPAGAFVLTITKALQDQYVSLFDDCRVFKGKTNYACDVDDSFDVEIAPCLMSHKLKESCWSTNRCPYYAARNDALTEKFTALNYKVFFTLPEHLKKKNYIICDEASELETEIVNNFTLQIDFEKIKRHGVPIEPLMTDELNMAMVWVEDNETKVKKYLDEIVNSFSKKERPISDKERSTYSYVKNLYNAFVNIINHQSDASWVIDRQKSVVRFIPLRVDKLAQRIFQFADKVLLMSATIVDHKKYAESLGIDDYEYVEAESSFDARKSPIFVSNKHKLNYNNLQQKLPLIADQIKEICEKYKDVKGIIHTHTMFITEQLKKYLGKDPRFLFRDGNQTNDFILEEHSSSTEPTVLVSPSLSFGVDLKDDLGRFCIVTKLPYLPLADKRIAKIFEYDKAWYANAMLNGLVQMCGRCTRNEDDFSDTYILDGNIVDILMRNKSKLPKYFLDRIA